MARLSRSPGPALYVTIVNGVRARSHLRIHPSPIYEMVVRPVHALHSLAPTETILERVIASFITDLAHGRAHRLVGVENEGHPRAFQHFQAVDLRLGEGDTMGLHPPITVADDQSHTVYVLLSPDRGSEEPRGQNDAPHYSSHPYLSIARPCASKAQARRRRTYPASAATPPPTNKSVAGSGISAGGADCWARMSSNVMYGGWTVGW